MSKLVFLKKRHELGEYEPDVHQTNIGSGWELLHYTGNIHILTQSLSFAECCAVYLMNRVVVTSSMERFTVTAASK